MLERLISLPPVSFCLEVWDTYARAGISRSAAALAYYLVLTLFPLVMCVNYFIGLFHFNLEQVLRAADALLPAGVTGVLGDYLTYVAGVRSPALLWASVFTILVSASAGLRTLFLALDELYEVRRPMGVKTTLVSVALSALFLVTIYFSVVVIFTGDWFFRLLERYLPRPLKQLLSLARVSGLWGWLRYLVLFCAVLLLVLALYRAGTPPRAMPRRTLRFAALLTALAMAVCSGVFSWFIGMSSRYALVYGSLASLIILLVWLYLCGNIMLLGAAVSRTWVIRRTR